MKYLYLCVLGLLVWSCDTVEIRRDRFFIQGNEALKNNEYDLAEDYYTKALELDGFYKVAYNNRGVARMEDDRPYEAIQDYNEALKIDAKYADCLFNRANAYESINRLNNAIKDLEGLENIFPDTVVVPFRKGLVYTMMSDYDAARKEFMRAYELDIADPHILINLATLDYYTNDFETAEERLTRVIRDYPDEANAYNTLNQIYIKRGEYAEALMAIQQAMEIEPAESYFLNNRGLTYLMLDSLALAIGDINESIVRDPSNMWAYRNKGLYFLKLEDYPQAVRYLNEAAESDEFVENAYLYLEMLYNLQGDLPMRVTRGERKQLQIWPRSVLLRIANSFSLRAFARA